MDLDCLWYCVGRFTFQNAQRSTQLWGFVLVDAAITNCSVQLWPAPRHCLGNHSIAWTVCTNWTGHTKWVQSTKSVAWRPSVTLLWALTLFSSLDKGSTNMLLFFTENCRAEESFSTTCSFVFENFWPHCDIWPFELSSNVQGLTTCLFGRLAVVTFQQMRTVLTWFRSRSTWM